MIWQRLGPVAASPLILAALVFAPAILMGLAVVSAARWVITGEMDE